MTAMTARCRYHGGALVPVGRHTLRLAEGETVIVTAERPRSMNSHRHQWAWLHEAWATLPESLRDEPFAASPEHLRKHALIKCGFADCVEVDCGTEAAARKALPAFVAAMTEARGYAVGQISGPVFRVWTAKSQSVAAMGGDEFKRSKALILDWVASLIEVSADQLEAIGDAA